MYLVFKSMSIKTNLSLALHALDFDMHCGIPALSLSGKIGILELEVDISLHVLDQSRHYVREENFELLLNAGANLRQSVLNSKKLRVCLLHFP